MRLTTTLALCCWANLMHNVSDKTLKELELWLWKKSRVVTNDPKELKSWLSYVLSVISQINKQ